MDCKIAGRLSSPARLVWSGYQAWCWLLATGLDGSSLLPVACYRVSPVLAAGSRASRSVGWVATHLPRPTRQNKNENENGSILLKMFHQKIFLEVFPACFSFWPI